MEKSARISLRCTKEQKRIIEANGKKAGMGISQYILQAALKEKSESGTGKQKRVSCLATLQKELNELEYLIKLGAEKEALTKQFEVIQEGVDALWSLSK